MFYKPRCLAVALCGYAIMVGTAARAADRLIVVLPLDVSHSGGKLGADARADLEEMLRDAATDALTSHGWTILTGETTLQVLQDNGVDAAKGPLKNNFNSSVSRGDG
jgi:hypothetical protein